MRKFIGFNLRRRWPLLALTGAVAGVAAFGVLRLQSLAQDLLPSFLKARLETALGRPVHFGALHLTPTGLWIDQLRVPAQGAEKADPLAAKTVRVAADWWSLIRSRQVKVDNITLHGAAVRLSPAVQKPEEPWTAQLVSLSGSGIPTVGFKNADVVMLSEAGKPTWAAEKIDGTLRLAADGFHYQTRIRNFHSGGVQLASFELKGSGDREKLTLEHGAVEYAGGRLLAQGKVGASDNAVDLQVKVDRMPLGQIAARVGIPADWAIQGTLTGTLTVGARDNALKSVHGTVNVARGSFSRQDGKFPWEKATARIDWTPAGARISGVRVDGDGVTLTADGTVEVAPGKPFTAGQFRLNGKVSAGRSGSVARVAELLAFRKALEGRWQAGSASVSFTASGVVGEVEKARAAGTLVVENLRFRPVADQEPAIVDRLSADVERTGDRLILKNVHARTDGFDLKGSALLTDDRPGHPGEFRAEGDVDVQDLKSLRRALPQAALWRWIPVASANASGKLSFRLGGEIAKPADLWSEGRYEAHNFRFSAASPLPSGVVFFFPVKTAKGTFKHSNRVFETPDLDLDAGTFTATGRMGIDFHGEPVVATDLRLKTDDWRALPAMPASAIPELSGGHMEAQFTLKAPLAKLSQAPVDGSFRLTNAVYQPGREGAAPLPVDEFGARFHWADRVLHLPQATIRTPLLTADAAGRIYPTSKRDYRLALDVKASSPDAAGLAERFEDSVRLTGGVAEAHVQLDAPVDHLMEASVTGTLDVRDVTVHQAVEELGLKEIRASSLSLDFNRDLTGWQVARVDLSTPGMDLRLAGLVGSEQVDADVHVALTDWSPPEKLPITGGKVDLRGKIVGETARPETLEFRGDVSLANAGLRLKEEGYALTGGAVSLKGSLSGPPADWEKLAFTGDLTVQGVRASFQQKELAVRDAVLTAKVTGSGELANPVNWLRSGALDLAGAEVKAGDRAWPKLERLTAQLQQEGERIRWTGAKLTAGGAVLTSSGWWSQKGHAADVSARVADLAPFGFELPGGVEVKDSSVAIHVEGTPQKPIALANGEVELKGVKLAAEGLPAQSFDQLTGKLRLDGEVIRIDSLKGSGPAGTLTARGSWSEKEHQLSVLVSGDDFSRLGLQLQEGFVVRGFRVEAEVAGTADRPASRVSGVVRVAGAEFPFGPEGPHKLDEITAAFSGSKDSLKLTEIAGRGPAGRFTGTGSVTAKGYRVDLKVPSMNPQVVRWLLPGQVKGGTLSGTVTLAGDDQQPVTLASGHFELADAGYVAPAGLGLTEVPVPLTRFAGDYHWEKGATRLTDVRIAGPVFTAKAELTATQSAGEATADIEAPDAGKVSDYWPLLNGMLKGGKGTGRLQARFTDKTVKGTLAMSTQGGTLNLPGMEGEFASHPVDTASMTLGFEPGKLTFHDVKVRGPKGNADGEGSWTMNGPVSASGKAWFSKSFTSKLMPKGIGWLAKLFGLKQIKSDFEIEGDSEKVHLTAGITRSFLWKFAKGRVSKEVRDIAQGKAPLWVKPLEVAESPEAEEEVTKEVTDEARGLASPAGRP